MRSMMEGVCADRRRGEAGANPTGRAARATRP